MYILYTLLVVWAIFQLLTPFLTVLGARLFGKEQLKPDAPKRAFDYGCIITAYKNAAIAKPLVQSLLKQTHPNLHIYLVADECPADFNLGMTDERLTVLQPDPPLRLKAKSIKYGIASFVRPHDYIAVFDADNLAHPDFLTVVNRYAENGHRCIQGQRTAKNIDSRYAAADSLGELYKNYIERYAPYLLGGSSVISGSGMATEAALYNSYLNSPEIEQGQHQWKKMLQEDKILQNVLLRADERIVYAWDALCYDEKIQNADSVTTQRSRWLFSYFQNIPNALGILRRGLFRGSWNQLFFGVVTLALPMFMQLGLAAVLLLSGLFISPVLALFLAVSMGVFALNVLWTMRLSDAPKPVWDALWSVPGFFWRQLLGLLRMNNPNKHFKHTEHTKHVSIEDLLKQDQK
jgi:cellulose synthase/poly-beta-1,6-N-acetylglucosamine synthase-like glycosyltransferase